MRATMLGWIATGMATACSSGGLPSQQESATAALEWACLDHPLIPVQRPAQRVTYSVTIGDLSDPNSPKAIPGLKLSVCAGLNCEAPVDDVAISSDGPNHTIVMPFDAWGFAILRVDAPGYEPLDYYLAGPMIGPPEGGYMVRGLPLGMTTLRSDLDAATGTLELMALDCRRHDGGGTPASGVSFDLRRDDTSIASVASVIKSLSPGAYYATGHAPSGVAYGGVAVAVAAGRRTRVEIRDGTGTWGQ